MSVGSFYPRDDFNGRREGKLESLVRVGGKHRANKVLTPKVRFKLKPRYVSLSLSLFLRSNVIIFCTRARLPMISIDNGRLGGSDGVLIYSLDNYLE